MKVYVVESGYYSDRKVVFVTERKEIAQKYCELHKNDYGGAKYSVFDTDKVKIETIENDKAIPYLIFLEQYNGGLEVEEDGVWYLSEDRERNHVPKTEIIEDYKRDFFTKEKRLGIKVAGYGNSYEERQKALKIAFDMRAKWLAEKKGV